MKNHDIVKLCADSLRTFLSEKHGIKLKSGHAHEIVAAFLGYKSAVAMRQDTRCPITSLDQAEYILFDIPTSLVEQRLASLTELPPDLPPSYVLAEGIYSVLVAQERAGERLWPSFHDLAVFLGEAALQQQIGHLRMNPAPQWIIDVEKEFTEEAVLMNVAFDYLATDGKRLSQAKINITLPRMAGNIGYGKATVVPILYSGHMRDPDFRLKHGNF